MLTILPEDICRDIFEYYDQDFIVCKIKSIKKNTSEFEERDKLSIYIEHLIPDSLVREHIYYFHHFVDVAARGKYINSSDILVLHKGSKLSKEIIHLKQLKTGYPSIRLYGREYHVQEENVTYSECCGACCMLWCPCFAKRNDGEKPFIDWGALCCSITTVFLTVGLPLILL